MKIKTINRKRPNLTITLKPHEYDIIRVLLGSCTGSIDGPRGIADKMCNKLEKYAILDNIDFDGSVNLKRKD
jgi:hypothetical protein